MTPRQYWTQIFCCLAWISVWYVLPICSYLHVHNVPWFLVAGFAAAIYLTRQFAYLTVVGNDEIGHVMKFNRKTGRQVDAGMYWTWKYLPFLARWKIHLGFSIFLERVLDLRSIAGTTNHYVYKNDREARHHAISRGSFMGIALQRWVSRRLEQFFTLLDEERRIYYGKLAFIGFWFLCWPAALICANFGGWQATPQKNVQVSTQAPVQTTETQTQVQGPHKVLLSSNRPIEVPPAEYFVHGASGYSMYQIKYTLLEEDTLFVNVSMWDCKLIPPGKTIEFVLMKPVRDAINMEKWVKVIIPDQRDTYRPWKDLAQQNMADYRYRYIVRALNVNGQGGVLCF